jgi:hypothetical protein
MASTTCRPDRSPNPQEIDEPGLPAGTATAPSDTTAIMSGFRSGSILQAFKCAGPSQMLV